MKLKKRIMSVILAVAMTVSFVAAVGVSASAYINTYGDTGINDKDWNYYYGGYWCGYDYYWGNYCPAYGFVPTKLDTYSAKSAFYYAQNKKVDVNLSVSAYGKLTDTMFKGDTLYATVESDTTWAEIGASTSAAADQKVTVSVERVGKYGTYYSNGKYYCDGYYGSYPLATGKDQYWLAYGRNTFKVTVQTNTLTDYEQGYQAGYAVGYEAGYNTLYSENSNTTKGYEAGYKAGYKAVYEKGYAAGWKDAEKKATQPQQPTAPAPQNPGEPYIRVIYDRYGNIIPIYPYSEDEIVVSNGTSTEYDKGYTAGVTAGTTDGEEEGYDDGYYDASKKDYNTAYKAGYEAGKKAYADAQAAPESEVSAEWYYNTGDGIYIDGVYYSGYFFPGCYVPSHTCPKPSFPVYYSNTATYYVVIDREEAAAPTYTITSSCNVGGKVSSDKVTVEKGETATVKFTPSTGYAISKVVIDGVDKGAITSYTFSNVDKNHEVSVYFVLLATEQTEKVPEVKVNFTDLPSSHWAFNYVKELVQAGIISGYPDGTFQPNGNVTWGEALKLVLLSCGYKEQTAAAGEYWADSYMKLAISQGFIDGAVDLRSNITREEIAKLAAAAMKLGLPKDATPFDDCDIDAASALYEAGILTGSYDDNGDLVFKPASNLTRAEFAAIIYRVYQKNA